VGPEILHGPLAPAAGRGGKNDDFGLLFLFYDFLFLDFNGHMVNTFLACFDKST
jgi:hypothetical protein